MARAQWISTRLAPEEMFDGPYDWLAFSPAYGLGRGNQRKLGAHAFRPEGGEGVGDRSLCGYAPRAKTTGRADRDARRCVACERIIAGRQREAS